MFVLDAKKGGPKVQMLTVVGFYPDNDGIYCDFVKTDDVEVAISEALSNGVAVVAVFEGMHTPIDSLRTVEYGDDAEESRVVRS